MTSRGAPVPEPARRGFFAGGFVTARVFASFFALGSLGFLVGAFGFGYSALTHERRVVASVQGNSLALPSEGRRYTLTLYGTTAGGEDPADADCRLTAALAVAALMGLGMSRFGYRERRRASS